MKNYSVPILAMVCTLILSACEKPNPLEKHEPRVLAEWLFEKEKTFYKDCAFAWVDRENAPPTILEACNTDANKLAVTFTNGGYGRVTSEHVQLPTLWVAYINKIKTTKNSTFDAEKARKSFQYNWGSKK